MRIQSESNGNRQESMKRESFIRSWGHCLVKEDNEKIWQVLANELLYKFQVHGLKHKLAYSKCCNSFNFQKKTKQGDSHTQVMNDSIYTKIDPNDITPKSIQTFLKTFGYTRDKGILFPMFNVKCQEYYLSEKMEAYQTERASPERPLDTSLNIKSQERQTMLKSRKPEVQNITPVKLSKKFESEFWYQKATMRTPKSFGKDA